MAGGNNYNRYIWVELLRMKGRLTAVRRWPDMIYLYMRREPPTVRGVGLILLMITRDPPWSGVGNH